MRTQMCKEERKITTQFRTKTCGKKRGVEEPIVKLPKMNDQVIMFFGLKMSVFYYLELKQPPMYC